MLAYMNKEALELTLKTNKAHYFSRSKQRIWQKGESSGNVQNVKEIFIDCDQDTILLKVEQVGGAACHTGRVSCFFEKIDSDGSKIEESPKVELNYSVIDKLYHVIEERKRSNSAESYVASLFEKGENTILKKVAEEAAELCFAIKDNNEDEIIYEAADLMFHYLIALSSKNINPDRVESELKRRFGIGGLEEKKSRDAK
jgi:phosphoribosyl-ATP pyrophosphohydrolase/phosphoribosyl-AMP cyclohydrolase